MGIGPKVNVIGPLLFELADNNVAVRHVRHFAMETRPHPPSFSRRIGNWRFSMQICPAQCRHPGVDPGVSRVNVIKKTCWLLSDDRSSEAISMIKIEMGDFSERAISIVTWGLCARWKKPLWFACEKKNYSYLYTQISLFGWFYGISTFYRLFNA